MSAQCLVLVNPRKRSLTEVRQGLLLQMRKIEHTENRLLLKVIALKAGFGSRLVLGLCGGHLGGPPSLCTTPPPPSLGSTPN